MSSTAESLFNVLNQKLPNSRSYSSPNHGTAIGVDNTSVLEIPLSQCASKKCIHIF